MSAVELLLIIFIFVSIIIIIIIKMSSLFLPSFVSILVCFSIFNCLSIYIFGSSIKYIYVYIDIDIHRPFYSIQIFETFFTPSHLLFRWVTMMLVVVN